MKKKENTRNDVGRIFLSFGKELKRKGGELRRIFGDDGSMDS
jgi:hypothetical protein